VEAQFDTLNKKKEWYQGVVTQVNGDDTMTVLFRTNVSEQNLHPDRVRLLSGKPAKVRALPPASTTVACQFDPVRTHSHPCRRYPSVTVAQR
jgi:hypothetical protein